MKMWKFLLLESEYAEQFRTLFYNFVIKKEIKKELVKLGNCLCSSGKELFPTIVLEYNSTNVNGESNIYLFMPSNDCRSISINERYNKINDYIILTPFSIDHSVTIKFDDVSIEHCTRISYYIEIIDWIIECMNVELIDNSTKSTLLGFYCRINEYVRVDKWLTDPNGIQDYERHTKYLKYLESICKDSNDTPKLKSISKKKDNPSILKIKKEIERIAIDVINELSKRDYDKLNQADLAVFYYIFKYLELGIANNLTSFCDKMEDIVFMCSSKREIKFIKDSIVKKADIDYFKNKQVVNWSDNDYKEFYGKRAKTIKNMIVLRDDFFKSFCSNPTAKKYLDHLK